MGRFFIKLFIFLALCYSSIHWISSRADGNTDNFYLKFTTPPKVSLILGTSRASQAIMPSILNSILKNEDMYNFAFTGDNSPYGKAYLTCIKRKLKSNSKNGLFILSVDPWSISCNAEEMLNPNSFKENNLILSTPLVNLQPNIFYLFKFCDHKYSLLRTKSNSKSSMFLHDDGWLEVNISMKENEIKKRTDAKIARYKTFYKETYFSKIRFDYLVETIKYLQLKGKVYLVRLPISKEMKQIELALQPNFDAKMDSVSRKYNIKYINFINDNHEYNYTDGNHLHKSSGAEISKKIALIIKENSIN